MGWVINDSETTVTVLRLSESSGCGKSSPYIDRDDIHDYNPHGNEADYNFMII